MRCKTTSILAVVLIAWLCIFPLAGCGNTKTIDGIEYDTYGLLNEGDKNNPKIQYELIWGNIIWGAILFETIVAPIYFYGFSIWEPVGQKTGTVGEVIKK